MLAAIFKAARNIDIKTPFDRLTYREAVDRYGSDKPDRRFAMELVDLGETFRASGFKVFRGALDAGGVVKAINAKGFAGITIGQTDELTEMAKLYGAKGLAFIKVENGEWKSPIVKFFSDAEKAALQSKLNIEEGDLHFLRRGQMGDRLRSARPIAAAHRRDAKAYCRAGEQSADFLWVTDFPLFEWSPEENKWNAMHHPFTRPKAEDMPLFEAKKFPEVRAEAYDVVLNGVEIGGGSMRIHEPELQEKMFEALGVSAEDRAIAVRPFAARASARRAAARRNRVRPRSSGHADLRRTKHPRRDGFPEEQSRHGPDVAVACRSRSKPAARLGNQAGERQACRLNDSAHHRLERELAADVGRF